MPEGPTKIRHLRMSDDLWEQVQARAAEEHTTATAWVVRLIVAALNGRDRNVVAGEFVAPMMARARRDGAVEALREAANLSINPEDFHGPFTVAGDLIEAGAGLLRQKIRERAALMSGVKALKR